MPDTYIYIYIPFIQFNIYIYIEIPRSSCEAGAIINPYFADEGTGQRAVELAQGHKASNYRPASEARECAAHALNTARGRGAEWRREETVV